MAFTKSSRVFNCKPVILAALLLCSITVSASFSPGEKALANLAWDNDSNPVNPASGSRYDQIDLPQWKAVCGDDPNEYLIKEHIGDSLESGTNADDYVCADRPTDCAFNGRVYSQGQLADLSEKGPSNEEGLPSNDFEVCLDLDDTLPGGEWYDMDADFMIEKSSKISATQFSNMSKYRHPAYWGDNPGTDRNKAPRGYATEDDCDSSGLNCDDNGISASSSPWFNAGNFTEGAKQDNYDVGGGVHNKVQDGSDQFEANVTPQLLNKWNQIYGGTPWTDPMLNSEPGLDNWSLSSHLTDSVGELGRSYDNGECYYRTSVPAGNKRDEPGDPGVKKTIKVFGNSYAAVEDFDNQGLNPSALQGVWKNPDDVSTVNFDCDITGPDWGYGYDTGNPSYTCKNGACDRPYSATGAPFLIEGNISFDYENNPGVFNQSNKYQSEEACGDDHDEYLLREKTDTGQPTFACADRLTDCVYGGQVYSEGQLVDVSSPRNEEGVESVDEEICIDSDNPEYEMGGPGPGSNWYDVDSEFVNQYLKGSVGSYNPNSTSTYEHFVLENRKNRNNPIRDSVKWFKPNTSEAALEASISPFNPLDYGAGYSLEDDVSSDVTYAEDSGSSETTFEPEAVYSFFKDRYETDDRVRSSYDSNKRNSGPVFGGLSGRMWIGYANGTAFYRHGKSISQQDENTPSSIDYSASTSAGNVELNDSTINRLEDTWAIVNETNEVVGPTGNVYEDGKCYGENPPSHSEGWIQKNETVVANSYAHSMDINGDGTSMEKGVWVDPDETVKSVSRGLLSCDLNSTDWGIGYDLTPSSSLNVYKGDARDYGYNIIDRHVVSGPIAFDDGQKPLGENQDDLKQYPNACGDDQNEFLIREQYSSYHGGEIYPNLTDRDNIYVCADRITDCAYNGAVYSEGQTLDISSQTSHSQEMGEQLPDEEICLDLNKSTPGGEWYDKDQEFTLEHRIKGLKDTYNVSNPSFTRGTRIDISGVVEGESSGVVNITDRDTNLNSDGSFFMSNVAADPGEMQLLKYYNSTGQLEAQIRLRFPSNGSDVERVHLSPELMYDGSEVWSGMEMFSDHDFDRNKYHSRYNSTDWRNQTTRYDRTDLAYFNRTGGYYSPPSHRTNVRGQQKRYYSPEGYATEDDCGPLLSKSSTGPCGDVGDNTQNKSWFSAGNFTGMAP